MTRTRTLPTLASALGALLAALLVTGCGDVSDFPPAPASSPGCTRACALTPAKALIPTPVAIPTLDPALVAWRTLVHDRVTALSTDLDAVRGCGGPDGDDAADCRRKVGALMADARSMRTTVSTSVPPAVPDDDVGKVTDALDLLIQGCIHDDAALASNQEFVWLPGDTTSKAFEQLVTLDDGWRTD